MKFIFAILCLVVVLNEGLAEKCVLEDVNKCVAKVEEVIEKLTHIQETGKDSDNYCSTADPEPKCLKDIPDVCKADFPFIPLQIAKANIYKNEFCGDNGKLYMDVAPCLTANNAVFKKCEKKEPAPEKMLCELVDFMLCTATFSKENCKHGGDTYGKALEERMKIKKGVCMSGVGYLANSFWTLATTVFSALLIRNKMQ